MSDFERDTPETSPRDQQLPGYLIDYIRERQEELELEVAEVSNQEAPESGTSESDAYHHGVVNGRAAELVGIIGVIGAHQEMENWGQGEIDMNDFN